MLLDKELFFSDEQAVTVTAASTNVLDMKAIDMGNGNPLTIAAAVGDTDFAGGTSIAVALQESDTATGSFTNVLVTKALLTANLTAGTVIEMGTVPCGTQQFLRLNYTVSGTMTAGAINSSIKLGANQDSAGIVIPK